MKALKHRHTQCGSGSWCSGSSSLGMEDLQLVERSSLQFGINGAVGKCAQAAVKQAHVPLTLQNTSCEEAEAMPPSFCLSSSPVPNGVSS